VSAGPYRSLGSLAGRRFDRQGRIEEARLVRRVHELSKHYPRVRHRKADTNLRAEGFLIGLARLRCIRKREGLRVARMRRKRRSTPKSRAEVDRALERIRVWSNDFVPGQTFAGKGRRLLTWINESTRECLWLETDRLLNSHDVVHVLAQLVKCRGRLGVIKSDSGLELVTQRVQHDSRSSSPTRSTSIQGVHGITGTTSRSMAYPSTDV